MVLEVLKSCLEREEKILSDLKAKYEDILKSDKLADENLEGRIQKAIGNAHLLLSKKLPHFRKLLEGEGNYALPIYPNDLQGYWEVIFIQIEQVKGLFDDIFPK